MTSDERRAMNSRNASRPRRPLTPAHRQAISESVRAAFKAGKRRRTLSDDLSPREMDDYTILRRAGGYSRDEALAVIGRSDLIQRGD